MRKGARTPQEYLELHPTYHFDHDGDLIETASHKLYPEMQPAKRHGGLMAFPARILGRSGIPVKPDGDKWV